MGDAPVWLLLQAVTEIKNLRGHRIRNPAQQYSQVTPPPRRLSLQTEEEYAQYDSFQSIHAPPIAYSPIYSPHGDILNNLVYVSEWCRDQYGSRNIQTALETCD